jgi:flagellar motor switch protein FliG
MDEEGLSDAAILLMSLGEEEAAEVFRHLSPQRGAETGRNHRQDPCGHQRAG